MRLLDIFIFVVVIGILAMIALPAYQSNMSRAKAYEAEMTLEVVKSILMNYYEKEHHFPIVEKPTCVVDISELELDEAELAGKFYTAADYTYTSNKDGSAFKLKAIGSKNGMKSIDREINDSGIISASISF